MLKNEFIYIVRLIYFTDRCGRGCINEEAVFTTLQNAQEYINELKYLDASEEDFLRYRIEILEVSLNKTEENINRHWLYDISGELIEEANLERYISALYNKKIYDVGDLVFIRSKYYNSTSDSISGDFGVVLEQPRKRKAIKGFDEGANFGPWMYVILFITEAGILDHMHAFECDLESVDEIPEEFNFLVLYSKYLKGEIDIPNNINTEINSEFVFVKNMDVVHVKKSGKVEIRKLLYNFDLSKGWMPK